MMGADEVILPAKLVRTPAGDELHLPDGQVLKLDLALPGADGQEIVIVVTTPAHYRAAKQELAKQLLQEIIKG